MKLGIFDQHLRINDMRKFVMSGELNIIFIDGGKRSPAPKLSICMNYTPLGCEMTSQKMFMCINCFLVFSKTTCRRKVFGAFREILITVFAGV